MAINRSTLQLLRRLQVAIGTAADTAVRSLTHAWTRSWDELSSAWQHGLSDTVAQAATRGQWPSAWELARVERLRQASIASEEALLKLGHEAGVTIRDGAGQIITATARHEPHLIASQLPAAAQAGAAARAGSRITPTALSAIVARTQAQIESAVRPLSGAASEAMRRELIKGISVGDNPRKAAGAMVSRVQGAFEGGLVRATTIARTEMLDAYRATSTLAHAANADVVSGWIWHAQLDARTCFPAGTLVLTRRGEVPIEAVQVGDKVLTHLDRWRPVAETMARPYVGQIITVEAGLLRVSATADHPFLVERQGELQWMQAGELRRGDCVFSHREGFADGSDHWFGEVTIERGRDNAHNGEPARLQELRLFGIPFGDSRLAVPVRFVDLKSDARLIEQEVDGSLPARNGSLLNVGEEFDITMPAVSDHPRASRSAASGITSMWVLPLMGRIADLPAESAAAFTYPCGGDLELGAATVARSFHRHIVSNVEGQTQAIIVYNLEVDEDHTYVADGFAVHNCPSCWSMHGTVHPADQPGPWDHPQGRCARVPKTRTWRELGFDIDEPDDTIVNARARFFSLPDVDQRTIMGPGRLALLKSGRVDWSDIPMLRPSTGWRPSYAPRTVGDLERVARVRAAGGRVQLE